VTEMTAKSKTVCNRHLSLNGKVGTDIYEI